MCDLLLAAGANIDALDGDGCTPLILAVQLQRQVAAQLLIHRRADVNLAHRRTKQTPLHYAIELGQSAVVDALSSAGADVTLKDSRGKTPAEIAPPAMKPLLEKAKKGTR